MPFVPGTLQDTGTVAEWMADLGVNSDDVVGWCAIYFDGTGQPDIFVSKDVGWGGATVVADPETLPEVDLQIYLVFHRHDGQVYVEWIDGHDNFSLIGKTNKVTGTLLTNQKFAQMQDRAYSAWADRELF